MGPPEPPPNPWKNGSPWLHENGSPLDPFYGSPLWFWELFINNVMLRFKQYLIERSGHSGISNQIQNVLDLVGLDANTKKTLTDLQTDLDSTDRSYRQEKGYDSASRARQSEYAQRMRDIESQVRSIGDSRPIRNLDSENMRVRYQTSMDTEIDPKLPADLQQLQRNIRGAAFEKQGYVAPHEQITGRPPISPSTPRLSDLEELERMGVVDAKNYRSDERGVLYRPGTLPSEEQRRATALKAQDVANIGGGPVSGNNPEAKQQRSDALRDYYTKSGKYAGRHTGITPDETGQQFIAPPRNWRSLGAAGRNLGAAGMAAAGSIAGSALTQGVQATTDVLGMVGNTPTGKDRMQIEKSFNSDMGLGFDLGPDGELVMDPAGREAARKRQQQGIQFPSMFQK